MVSRYDPNAEPTIWHLPDDLWREIEPLLPPEKPPGTPGRPVVPFRQVLDGILFVLRTGCQWKAVPQEYGSGSTCHRRFQQWVADGTWERLWRDQLERYDQEYGIGWDWQSADSATVPSPPRRGRYGTGPHQPGEVGDQAPHPERPTGRAA
jgi:transposase